MARSKAENIEQISYNGILLNEIDRLGEQAPQLLTQRDVNQKYGLFGIYAYIQIIESILSPFLTKEDLKKYDTVSAEQIVSMSDPYERARCFDALIKKLKYLLSHLRDMGILPTRDRYNVFEGTLEDLERIRKGEIPPPAP